MSNLINAALSYYGLADCDTRKREMYDDGTGLTLAVEIKVEDKDMVGIVERMKAMHEQAPEPLYVDTELPSEERMRDEYNSMDKRSRSEFGAFHRYKAWRLGTVMDATIAGKVELPAHVYLSPAEATPQQKAMAIGRDEKGNYAVAVEDLTDDQKAAHIERRTAEELEKLQGERTADIVGPTADQMRQVYIDRTMAAHERLNGADGKPTSNADDFGGLPG